MLCLLLPALLLPRFVVCGRCPFVAVGAFAVVVSFAVVVFVVAAVVVVAAAVVAGVVEDLVCTDMGNIPIAGSG